MLQYCNALAHVIEPVPFYTIKANGTNPEKSIVQRSRLKHQGTILKATNSGLLVVLT